MKELQVLLQKQFEKMCKTGKLFRVSLKGDDIWKIYLENFPEKYRTIFRDPNSTEHNCNNCKNFIRRYGNIVAIDDKGNLMSIFSVKTTDEEYVNSIKALDKAITKSAIENVFFETFAELNALNYESTNKTQSTYKLGIARNLKQFTKEESDAHSNPVDINKIYEFHHFAVDLPTMFVDKSGKSIEAIMATYRDKKEVFKRGMEEISIDTLHLVRDLIIQKSILNGESYLELLQHIITIKETYNDCPYKNKENWYWDVTFGMSEGLAKFRNTLLGTLCVELTQGKELNVACLDWNKRADPANYMKATAPITKKQIEEAQKFVEENGYTESFDRRLATIDDIKASEILHINSGNAKVGQATASIFDKVKATATQHKRAEFKGIQEISIEKFMSEVLPTATGVEVFLENRLKNNLAVLTTASTDESNPIFKWNNNYSWTYANNLAGKSEIKQAVEKAGGKTDGFMRFSIMWSPEDSIDDSDLDAHCHEVPGSHIYFSNKISSSTGGNLDVDITGPLSWKRERKTGVVENITYPDFERIKGRTFNFYVNQFSARNSQGFTAELEINGEIYQYSYSKGIKSGANVQVVSVTVSSTGAIIKHHLEPTELESKEIDMWSLPSNHFHKVNLVCLSPNYWGENKVGNKHYMFMLEGCKAPHAMRTFHNENLNAELLKHRKVMEVLGASAITEPTDKHLAGVGFNATVTDEVIVRVSGTHKRVMKIKF